MPWSSRVRDELARRGLRVVTQPGFIAHRGDDYLRELPTTDHADLYRGRSLHEAGVPLALSSDAPYGPLDPWTVIAAACTRSTPDGKVAGPDERLPAATALDAYLAPPDAPGGAPRRITAGTPADLALLPQSLAAALDNPRGTTIRATLIAGLLVHSS